MKQSIRKKKKLNMQDRDSFFVDLFCKVACDKSFPNHSLSCMSNINNVLRLSPQNINDSATQVHSQQSEAPWTLILFALARR